MNKTYIGDSVYAQEAGMGGVVLTTENGYPDDPRNRIVLEGGVWHMLLEWKNRIDEEWREARAKQEWREARAKQEAEERSLDGAP